MGNLGPLHYKDAIFNFSILNIKVRQPHKGLMMGISATGRWSLYWDGCENRVNTHLGIGMFKQCVNPKLPLIWQSIWVPTIEVWLWSELWIHAGKWVLIWRKLWWVCTHLHSGICRHGLSHIIGCIGIILHCIGHRPSQSQSRVVHDICGVDDGWGLVEPCILTW